MGALDAVFNRSPLTPPQVDMGSGAAGTVDAPLLLLATYTTEPSLWISTGVIGTITIPAGPQGQTEQFTDNGWTILAQLRNFSSTIGPNATFDGNDVYQTPASETQTQYSPSWLCLLPTGWVDTEIVASVQAFVDQRVGVSTRKEN